MRQRCKILAVDDTKSNIAILLEHLSNDYDVIPALSGKKALDIAARKPIDLILLDIMMPEMDGYEVCTLLKTNNATKDIPVIFITAATGEDAIEKAYDAGGIDYVIKPFRPKELLARIKRELQLQQLIRELESSREELRVLAATDAMTKLYNRRSFTNIASHLIGQAKRNKEMVSLLMVDIDKFKRINDTYGHDIGDQVIIAIASNLKKRLRKGDVIARYGGEEFVILLPDTPIDGACRLAEEIRERIEDFVFEMTPGGEVQLTISIGATLVDAQKEVNLEPALKRADIALYQAKEGGRNRLVKKGIY